MRDIDKVVKWGSERLRRHEQDMSAVLSYLYTARARTDDQSRTDELSEMIQIFEAELRWAHTAQERLDAQKHQAA